MHIIILRDGQGRLDLVRQVYVSAQSSDGIEAALQIGRDGPGLFARRGAVHRPCPMRRSPVVVSTDPHVSTSMALSC